MELEKCEQCEDRGFVWLTPNDGRTPLGIFYEDKLRWVTCSKCNVHGRKHTFADAVKISYLEMKVKSLAGTLGFIRNNCDHAGYSFSKHGRVERFS